MSDTIYKYPLSWGRTTLHVPPGTQLLHIAMQNDQICLWVQVDPAGETLVDRAFQVIGTGHPVPDKGRWIGTCMTQSQDFVWHVYEVAP